jgi:hypothetical protein
MMGRPGDGYPVTGSLVGVLLGVLLKLANTGVMGASGGPGPGSPLPIMCLGATEYGMPCLAVLSLFFRSSYSRTPGSSLAEWQPLAVIQTQSPHSVRTAQCSVRVHPERRRTGGDSAALCLFHFALSQQVPFIS